MAIFVAETSQASHLQRTPVSDQRPTDGQVLVYVDADGVWEPATVAGTGTVTSVAATVPSFMTVSGSPVTASGTLALGFSNKNPNLVLAGPTTGAAATPTFRALVAADVPDVSATYETVIAAALLAPLASPTFTGTVTVPNPPVNATDASPKAYVDSNVVHKTSAYAALAGDVVLVDTTSADVTITLPAPSAKRHVVVKKVSSDSHNVIVTPPSGTIDGASTFTFNTQYESQTFIGDATNFFII